MKKIVLLTGILAITSATAMNQTNRPQGNIQPGHALLLAFILTELERALPPVPQNNQLPQVQPLAPYNKPLPQPVYMPHHETPPYQQHQRKASNPYTRHRNRTSNGIRVSPHHFGPTKNKE